MQKKATDFQIITARYYTHVFNCSYKTARAWFRQDLEMLGRRRLTLTQFEFIYGTCEAVKVDKEVIKKR